MEIHPMKTEDGTYGPVIIELIHTTPREAPPLVGISYTWKSSMRNYTVSTTNKEVLYIVRSVRDILQRLDPKGSDQSTHIWTDQLCINQADKGIKWQQFRIMRSIREHAMGTFVVLCRVGDAIEELLFMTGQLGITPMRSIIGPWSRNRLVLSGASLLSSLIRICGSRW